jgi:hypothetical protein
MSTKASNQIQISENVNVSNGINSNEADSNETGLNGNVSKEID